MSSTWTVVGKPRPCIVLSSDRVVLELRFPLVVVVPLTTTPLGPFYPKIGPYTGGLRAQSTVLVDNIRGIDKQRITRRYPPIPSADLQKIELAVAELLGLTLA
jgi:mRNA-degrading endonuclease toxin of MazEF toxin-antitoxin module